MDLKSTNLNDCAGSIPAGSTKIKGRVNKLPEPVEVQPVIHVEITFKDKTTQRFDRVSGPPGMNPGTPFLMFPNEEGDHLFFNVGDISSFKIIPSKIDLAKSLPFTAR